MSMLVPLLLAALAQPAASADSARCPIAPVTPAPLVHVVADAAGDTVAFPVLGAELRMEAAPPARGGGVGGTPTELRVTRRVDALTPVFTARLAAGRRLAAVVVELPGGTDTVRVRLSDASVVVARLVFPVAAPDAEAQRLAQEVAVQQLAADREEAARQLAEAEAIADLESRDRRKLVPANALARARDQLRLLDVRLAAARRQRALTEERLTRAALPTEEVTLRAERAEVLSALPR